MEQEWTEDEESMADTTPENFEETLSGDER